MTHPHVIMHVSREVGSWMDFYQSTGDPRALVMAQVASLIALNKADPPPPTKIDGANSP